MTIPGPPAGDHCTTPPGVLAKDRMAEAEVSVRLALFLLRNNLAAGDVEVAIDGAQVRTGGTVHFALAEFLAASGCAPRGAPSWQGRHAVEGCRFGIHVHSTPGLGDVVVELTTGHTLRAECKKGPLVRSPSSQEYPLLREAIGQLVTIEQVRPADVLAVAVPHSPRFAALAARWRAAPLVRRLGLRLLTVDRSGAVAGLEDVVQRGGPALERDRAAEPPRDAE